MVSMAVVLLIFLSLFIQVHSSEVCSMLFSSELDCKCDYLIDEPESWIFHPKTLRCSSTDNGTHIYVQSSFCMSYNETTGISLGDCPYNSCIQRAENQCVGEGAQFVKIPREKLQINDVMCGEINRTGLLCSKCKKGLGPAVFCYGMPCVECLGNVRGWLLYLTVAFTFPMLFFALLVTLQLNVSSCTLDGMVLMCQFVVNKFNWFPEYVVGSEPYYSLQVFVITIYGIWNLDFFRYYIPPFCINENMSALQVVSLEYLVAVYPLLLIAAVYFLIEIHDRDYRALVLLWRPFRRCFTHIPRQWNPKATIIHAFASFLLLSYVKIAAISFTLLRYTGMYNGKFVKINEVFGSLYIDPAIQLFSNQHAPYAALSFFMLSTFTFLPLILLVLYPLRLIQRCLPALHVKASFVREVIRSLQGCYKDGTDDEGTRDLRSFAAAFLFLRMVFAGGMFVIPDIIPDTVTFGLTQLLALAVAFIKPYKNYWSNVWSSLVLVAIGGILFTMRFKYYLIAHVFVNIFLCLPMLYKMLWVFLWFVKCIKCAYKRSTGGHTCTTAVGEESLPYRLLHSDLQHGRCVEEGGAVKTSNL